MFYKNPGDTEKFWPLERFQVPYWGRTSISDRRTEFSRVGDLAFGICAPLIY
jgi:hypothetical protein